MRSGRPSLFAECSCGLQVRTSGQRNGSITAVLVNQHAHRVPSCQVFQQCVLSSLHFQAVVLLSIVPQTWQS